MKLRRLLGLLFLVLALVLALALPALSRLPSASSARGGVAATGFCPPLLPPEGTIVDVSDVAGLQDAVNAATSGTTIRVADGVYDLDGVYLRIDVPGVTLRSASGDREAVVLDGNYVTTEIIQVAASDVTIADLTLREAYYHPIHVMSSGSGDTLNTRIYNVHIVDPGQQAIKINPAVEGYYPDGGEVACSHIELTDAGRAQVWAINGSCYTGGVDAHQARDWVIRDNAIEGFWCPGEGDECWGHELSEHGVHMWRGCRDTVVERNVLDNNARGIGFGLATSGEARTYPDDPCPGAGGGYVDHYGGVIRNNFVFANRGGLFASDCGFDSGIALWQACGARVLHNTVASTQDPAASSIEWRFDHTEVDVVNNLVTYRLWDRGGAASLSGNLEYQPLSLFVDGSGGDLHLAPAAAAAIDQVAAPADVPDDIDGDLRPIGTASDVGADEYGVSPPAAVTDLRAVDGVAGSGALTVTLSWTAPANAVTYTLGYSGTVIGDANWESAISMTVPFTASAPGSIEGLTVSVPYAGGTIYFALRSRNTGGDWSGVSNNAFWPHLDVCLPLALRDD